MKSTFYSILGMILGIVAIILMFSGAVKISAIAIGGAAMVAIRACNKKSEECERKEQRKKN